MSEDLFLNLLKRSGVEQPLDVKQITGDITTKDNLKKIKAISGPGVYLIKGYRSEINKGETEEVLYIGKTRSKSRDVGARIHEQLNSDKHSFRKNITEAGYSLCLTYPEYERVLEGWIGKGVYITEIYIFLFDKTHGGLLGRDILEPLLIHASEETPYFNREFTNTTTSERDQSDFDNDYNEGTKPIVSVNEIIEEGWSVFKREE